MSLAARAVLLAFLALWTLGFLRHGMDARYLMGSFLHLVHLPFHEAGHVLLMPFGRFLAVLGGSLFQLAISFALGALTMLVALGWGGGILWRQRARLQAP